MKRVIGTVLSMFFLAADLSAQKVEDIISLPLQVATHKTSNLIFPASIKSVDKGNRDILAQKAKGIENVLQLKALRPDFEETSLTVITDDGKLYAFTLTYNKQPEQLNLKITSQNLPQARFEKPSQHEIEETSMLVSSEPPSLRGRSKKKDGVSLKLQGIYIKGQVMYYQFRIENRTAISYDVSQFRFSIRDKRQTRRTSIQQQQLPVLLALDKTEKIPSGRSQQIVIALEKRTIPDQKVLIVQLMEEKGGRHLTIRLKNRHLIQAKPLTVD